MNKQSLKWITIGTAVLYSIVLVGWQLYTPHAELTTQEPGADNRPAELARSADDVKVGEFFMKYEAEAPTGMQGVWAAFRGSNRDNIIQTSEAISTSGDYPEMWSFTTGEGHAAPVIYKGRVYVLDYDETLLSDMLRCFSLDTGEELWRRWYRVRIKRNHGFSRTIPAVGDGYIITMGPNGHVMCCDPESGEMKWTRDMQKEYETEVPFWYTGQCPLIDGNEVILAPAGTDTLMVGMDIQTGEVKWATENTVHFKMSHSSIMPMNLNGKKTYVYIGVGGVCGVSAEGADKGKLLWSTNKWQPSVVAPSPLRVSANQIFLVAGYGNGGALLQVDGSGTNWKATVLDQYKADKGLASEQQTPILYNGKIISILPKDGGANRSKLVVYNPSNLHAPVWTSAQDERFGLGPYLVINDKLFAFNEEGVLYVYQIEANGMTLLKKQEVMEGVDAWGPLAYADGRLVLRDSHTVKCLKITE